MGGEAAPTGQIERLMAPTPRITGQASRCKRSAWISLKKTDVPTPEPLALHFTLLYHKT
jgi:hypothetical protein